MTYSDEGSSLNITQPLAQEEMTHEALEKDIQEIITILQESRPIIKTLKYSDRHKKLLDNVLMDKLNLDEEVEPDEEEAAKVIGKGKAKTIANKIKMLDHLKAELMGILKDVLCQVGVTTILVRFLILDIPVDKDFPIVVGRSFLYTCGGIINIINGTNSTFDGICHQKFPIAAVKNKLVEKDSDDDEEIIEERDENGKPFYGPSFTKYLDCDNPMERTPALQETLNPFRKIYVWKKMVTFLGSLPVSLQHNEWMLCYADNSTRKFESDGAWHLKCSIVDPYGNEYNQGNQTKATHRELSRFYKLSDIMSPNWAAKTKHNTNLARLLPKQIYASSVVDWELLNAMGCGEEIERILEIKLVEMGGDQEIFSFEAWRRAFDINEPIYAELCHEFYFTYEFNEVRKDLRCIFVEVYIVEHFNAMEYWFSISREEDLHLSRSHASTIRKPILRVLQKMISYGLCQRTNGHDKVQKNDMCEYVRGKESKRIGKHDPNNNNGWIEWDVPLGGGVDEPMVNPEFDEEEMDDDDDWDDDEDDDDWDDDVEWLMAPMKEVSDVEVADSIAIGEIYLRVATVKEQVQVDSRVDTYPSGQMAVPGQDMIVGLSQQVQTLQSALHETELQNQQLQTRVAEIKSHVGILMSYMLWMEERLTVLEKRLPGPPPGPQ
nr:hypothetical protein [Tanacetum cinerariifolium]